MSAMPKPWKHPKSGIYYHRIDVPKDIRDVVGKTSVKFSLNTRDFSEAKRLFALRYAETQALFEQARNQVSLTPKDIEVLAQRWLRDAVKEVENTPSAFGSFVVETDDEALDMSNVLTDAIERGYHSQLKWVKHHVERLLHDNSILLVEGSDQYKSLVEKICWRLLELSRLSLDRLQDNWSSNVDRYTSRAHEPLSVEHGATVKSAMVAAVKPRSYSSGQASSEPSLSVSDVVDSYTKHKSSLGSWDTKTEADAVGAYGLLVEYLGAETDVRSVTREQIRSFVNVLARLPVNYARKGHLKGMSLQQLVAYSEANDEKTASSSTVKKKMVFVKALFAYALEEDWVDKDRAQGISVPKGDVLSRVPYGVEQLSKIFNHFDVDTGAANYWVPRVALTTGMRSNEILQLTTADVRLVDGVAVFDLNRNLDDESGKEKKLKRDNSERLVPVPDVLLNLGFMSFVESVRTGRLFAEVKLGTNGTYSSTYGKAFNEALHSLGLKPPKGSGEMLDFHCFRHTFRANCRAYGVSDEYANLIGGWKDQKTRTSGDSYGVHFETFIKQLKRNIDLIQYESLEFA